MLRIGTAGWGIPAAHRDNFPSGDSLLERYAQVFNFVEINSSFYRSHQKKTYAKWASITPPDFLFSVKMNREITHKRRLMDVDALLDQFIEEVNGLGNKLGAILIQLPPSLQFDPLVANDFFKSLRKIFSGKIALEARHTSWSKPMLDEHNIIQVIADPAVIEVNSDQPFQYYRLHGSPKIYSSSYSPSFLTNLSKTLDPSSFVIFDNTQFGAATQNALQLQQMNR